MKVADLIKDLQSYPLDAEVTRVDVTVQSPSCTSKLSYRKPRKERPAK